VEDEATSGNDGAEREKDASASEAASAELRLERLFDPDRPRRFAPGDLIPEAASAEESDSEAHRYQRLAGAAVVLAQRQTDEANEKLELLVEQHRKLRQLFFVSAGSLLGVLTLMVVMLWSSSSEAGRAGAQELALRQGLIQAESRANLADREAEAARRELSEALGRLGEVTRRVERAETIGEDRAEQMARLEAELRWLRSGREALSEAPVRR
jgi:hypothetical protein